MAIRKEYRVGGRDDYIVDYSEKSDGTYQMHVRRHPHDPYQRGPHVTHLYDNGSLCVTAGREPRSLGQAETIAKAWMESYSNYTRTGRFG